MFLDQMGVIEIEMRIAAHPNQLPRIEIYLLGQHSGEQSSGPEIERQAECNIAATLVKTTVQPPTRDMKLIGLVTRREGHLIQLAHIPALKKQPA